ETVAAAILDYVALGADLISIRGYDNLNDVVDYGRDLLPILRAELASVGAPACAADRTWFGIEHFHERQETTRPGPADPRDGDQLPVLAAAGQSGRAGARPGRLHRDRAGRGGREDPLAVPVRRR